MSIKMSTLIWHDASLMSPTKDGRYLIEWNFSDKEVDVILYTVEGGWNSYRDHEGVLHLGHIIPAENITVWTEFPTIVERSIE